MPGMRPSDQKELQARRRELERKVSGLSQDRTRLEKRLGDALKLTQAKVLVVQDAERALEEARGDADIYQQRSDFLKEGIERMDAQIAELRGELRDLERTVPRQAPQRADLVDRDALLRHAERFGFFSVDDLAALLKAKPRVVQSVVDTLVTEGALRNTGQVVMRKVMYEFVVTEPEPEPELEPEPEPEVVPEPEVARVAELSAVEKQQAREWVTGVGEFTRPQLGNAMGWTSDQVNAAVGHFLSRGAIRDVGLSGAELLKAVDTERARPEPKVKRGAPVAGTGSKMKIADPDTRALVAIALSRGATAKHVAGGHIEVSYKGRTVNIASTPSTRRSVLNDRTRLRRIGLDMKD